MSSVSGENKSHMAQFYTRHRQRSIFYSKGGGNTYGYWRQYQTFPALVKNVRTGYRKNRSTLGTSQMLSGFPPSDLFPDSSPKRPWLFPPIGSFLKYLLAGPDIFQGLIILRVFPVEAPLRFHISGHKGQGSLSPFRSLY